MVHILVNFKGTLTLRAGDPALGGTMPRWAYDGDGDSEYDSSEDEQSQLDSPLPEEELFTPYIKAKREGKCRLRVVI